MRFKGCGIVYIICHYIPGPSGKKGSHGAGGAQDGADAEHRVVQVPCGTIVKEKGVQLIDLKQHGDRYIAARGGIGGLGNRFGVSCS